MTRTSSQTPQKEVLRRTLISFKRRSHHLYASGLLALIGTFFLQLDALTMLLSTLMVVSMHALLILALRFKTHLDRVRDFF